MSSLKSLFIPALLASNVILTPALATEETSECVGLTFKNLTCNNIKQEQVAVFDMCIVQIFQKEVTKSDGTKELKVVGGKVKLKELELNEAGMTGEMLSILKEGLAYTPTPTFDAGQLLKARREMQENPVLCIKG